MKALPLIAVVLIMLATGMSLDRSQFAANWRRLTHGMWTRLLVATFIVPPVLTLLLAQALPINPAALAGLFLVAVAPGAPLMTRNVAKHGFDMQMAASYQLWGALLAPIMIPLLVGGAGLLYGRGVWISPLTVLVSIAKQQLAPLLSGMLLMHFAPTVCTNIRRPLNVLGNLVLTIALIYLLWKVGPTLATVGPWLAVAVFGLAAGCLAAMRVLVPSEPILAVSNVNRHVGLALLLSGTAVQNSPHAVPALAAYALAAPLVMASYVRLIHSPTAPLDVGCSPPPPLKPKA